MKKQNNCLILLTVKELSVVTNIPLTVQIKFDEDLTNEDIGDENFISDVQNWKESSISKKKKEFSKNFEKVFDADQRKPS